jgi:hypothetical protein
MRKSTPNFDCSLLHGRRLLSLPAMRDKLFTISVAKDCVGGGKGASGPGTARSALFEDGSALPS